MLRDRSIRHPKSVARAVSRNFRAETDFRLLAQIRRRTRWTSLAMLFEKGSKMVLDATGYGHEPDRIDGPQLRFDPTSDLVGDLEASVTLRQHLGFAGEEWLSGASIAVGTSGQRSSCYSH